ncbi:MAG: MYXO-CTERM sorting domain-containing protein, partial [Bradymonadaceae bacterium]
GLYSAMHQHTWVDYAGSFLFELEGNASVDGQCDREEQDEPDACREIDPSTAGIDVTARQNRSVTISVEYEVLQEYFDRQEAEKCVFEGESAGIGTATSGLSHDAGPTDAGATDVFGPDTGSDAMDAGSTADIGFPGGGDGSFDRIYAVRAFIDGRTPNLIDVETKEELVDAALRLDRTRPPAPSEVSDALVSENKLNIRFTPPSDTGDVAGYSVFISRTPLDPSTPPEKLQDRKDVKVRQLSEASDSTIWQSENIDRSEGEAVHLAVAARDEAGNFSRVRTLDRTETVEKSPNFWERYKRIGGEQPGGCRTSGPAGPGPMFPMVVLGLVAAGRRRHR